MRLSNSWMVARVAASGIRDGVLVATASERAGAGGVDLGATALGAKLSFIGGGGGTAATFFLHPLNAPHSTVTARAAKNREFMKYPPIPNIQEKSAHGVSRGNSILTGVRTLYRIDSYSTEVLTRFIL